MTSLPRTLVCGFVVFTIGVAIILNHVVAQPYMDEIFHIPQAQRYCKKDYRWDVNITTLPGLYMISVAFLRLPVATLLLGADTCTTPYLRGINVGLGLASLWLIQQIQRLLGRSKGVTHSQSLLTAVVMCSFPLHYFFFFLYYTDVGSTFFVLLMYYWSLKRHFLMSAGAGLVAIVFRQTNVIWMVFTAGTCVLRFIDRDLRATSTSHPTGEEGQQGDGYYGDAPILTLIDRLWTALRTQSTFLLRRLWPYMALALAFVVFLVVNKGIVVGDRSNHTAGFHLPQLGYFSCLILGFALPVVATFIRPALKSTTMRQLRGLIGEYVILCAIYTFAVWKFTVVHRFIQADNRHYTFYIWRRTIGLHWWVRYALVPFYAAVTQLELKILNKSCGLFWVFGYCCAVILVLVPQTLVEPRYFILPYLVYRIHLPQQSTKVLLTEGAIYMLVNIVTLYMFLYKPFEAAGWGQNNLIQRFMW